MKHPLTLYREKHGLTLESMADKLSVNRATLWRWEKGRIAIPFRKMQAIEDATGVPKRRLLSFMAEDAA